MKGLVTVIYKPIGIVAGVLAGLLGSKIFKFVWGKIDEEDPPKPNTQWVTWGKLLSAAALEGMIFKLVRAFVDRGVARTFYNFTGFWPGERTPEPK